MCVKIEMKFYVYIKVRNGTVIVIIIPEIS